MDAPSLGGSWDKYCRTLRTRRWPSVLKPSTSLLPTCLSTLRLGGNYCLFVLLPRGLFILELRATDLHMDYNQFVSTNDPGFV